MKFSLSWLLILGIAVSSWAQTRLYNRSFQVKPGDVVKTVTLPVSQTVSSKHILLKPKDFYVLTPRATKDTIIENNLRYLYENKGCPVDKTLNKSGCVNLTYTDGTRRIVCDKQYEAVITPDGKVHVLRQITLYSLTFPLTPPTLPNDQAVLDWLNKYNEALLKNLLDFAAIADQSALKSEILKKEKVMKLDVYGQVVNRVNLLEQFARLH